MARRLIALVALLAASCGGALSESASTSAPETWPAAPGSAGVAAGLRRVIDGDSLTAAIGGEEAEVRLLGVNAPERGECFDAPARAAAARFFEATPLYLEVMPERDQFGRLLAYAYAGGLLVNRELLDGGYALALQTEHARLAEFLAADQRAYDSGVGMWAADACGPAAGASAVLREIQADPAGPDEDDLNGEWVRLANEGDRELDLSGWVLRDESSAHRYRFPIGAFLRPGEEAVVRTGCGADTHEERFWCAEGPVWNNTGDTALLLDPAGNVAFRLRYP